MTIDNDIMRMTQEDMVDEIMTLRGQRKALTVALKAFIDAENKYRSEVIRCNPQAYDDPLAHAHNQACAVLASIESEET